MRRSLQRIVQQLPMKWAAALRRSLTASAIAASNSIEGYRVDPVDVADLLDGEREAVDASEEDKKETLAYQQARTYIQSLWDARDFEYSKGLLNALHWMLQGRHHPHRPAGRWRSRPIVITAGGRTRTRSRV